MFSKMSCDKSHAHDSIYKARFGLMKRRSSYSECENEYIEKCAALQYRPPCGEMVFQQRWKQSVDFAGSVLTCQQTVTRLDVMVTICVEGQMPVNLILDTAYNNLHSIHKEISTRFNLEKPLYDYEYTCEVLVVPEITTSARICFVDNESPEIMKKTRHLGLGELDWLMNGHVIMVKEKKVIRVEPTDCCNLPPGFEFPEDILIQRFLTLDPTLIEHAKTANRYKTYMADLYMAATIVKRPLMHLLLRPPGSPLAGKRIMMVHDALANDVDDLLLRRLFEEMGAQVFTFDVWTSTDVSKPEPPYALCITGPITPRANAFLETLDEPAAVFWSLDPNGEGSNAREPKRLAFRAKNVSGGPMTREEADADGKFPFVVPLGIGEATAVWKEKWPGINAIPSREDRLFTVSFDI